jgi:riboflavin kinase/FMN adenylyltransferase
MLELLVVLAKEHTPSPDRQPRALHTHAVTFDPHPGVVLGRGSPPLLTTLDRRAELVRALGVDDLSVCPFDADLATWSPRRFVEELLVGELGVRLVVVGEDFRFGAQRAGDFALLKSLGGELGFEAVPAPLAGDANGPFSSSRARDAIRAGDMAEATRVLGRPHAFTGTVVRGAQRGRTIGFPTANLEEIPEMVPPRGVYAVDVTTGSPTRGVMNIGVRPTVSGESETREVHLLDWSGDLYGRRITVDVLERIRDEKKFGSLDELKAQIEKDASAARAWR